MSKARRNQRKSLRAKRKANKTQRRSDRKEKRFNARDQRKTARLSKRQANKLSKIYGDMSPEEINELNAIQPEVGAMSAELRANDVPINDEEDTIEIASKYAVMNEDIEDPVEADDVEAAYSENRDPDVSDFEHAEKRSNSRSALKAGLTGVTAALGSYFGDLKQKQASGDNLTPKEQALLDAKRDITKQAVKNATTFNLQQVAPLLILAAIAFFVFKK